MYAKGMLFRSVARWLAVSAIPEAAACTPCMARLSLHSRHGRVGSEKQICACERRYMSSPGFYMICGICLLEGASAACEELFMGKTCFEAAGSHLGERHQENDALS